MHGSAPRKQRLARAAYGAVCRGSSRDCRYRAGANLSYCSFSTQLLALCGVRARPGLKACDESWLGCPRPARKRLCGSREGRAITPLPLRPFALQGNVLTRIHPRFDPISHVSISRPDVVFVGAFTKAAGISGTPPARPVSTGMLVSKRRLFFYVVRMAPDRCRLLVAQPAVRRGNFLTRVEGICASNLPYKAGHCLSDAGARRA